MVLELSIVYDVFNLVHGTRVSGTTYSVCQLMSNDVFDLADLQALAMMALN